MSVETTIQSGVKPKAEGKVYQGRGFLKQKFHYLIRRGLVVASAGVILFVILCSVLPGWFVAYSPTLMDSTAILQAPGSAHIFGTDQYGRDIYSLLVYGSKSSLSLGIGSVLIGGILGSTIGVLAGYWGRFADSLLMRIIEIMMTIPGVLFAIVLSASLGPSLTNTMIAVGLSAMPGYARVMRSQVIAIKNLSFVEAARAAGHSHTSLFFRHLLPNCLPPLIVMATIGVGSAILIGTALSFLGLGVVSELPDWGYLLSLGRDYLSVAWWISFFPGAAISLLVIAINLLGDELRNRMDPRADSSSG